MLYKLFFLFICLLYIIGTMRADDVNEHDAVSVNNDDDSPFIDNTESVEYDGMDNTESDDDMSMDDTDSADYDSIDNTDSDSNDMDDTQSGDSDSDHDDDDDDDDSNDSNDDDDDNHSNDDSNGDDDDDDDDDSNNGDDDDDDDNDSNGDDDDDDDDDDTNDSINNGDDDDDDDDEDDDDDDKCSGLTQTECGDLREENGENSCGYNIVTDSCYEAVRRAGLHGTGNFDDGFAVGQEVAQSETSQLYSVVGVLGGIIAILLCIIIGTGYYIYNKSIKNAEAVHQAVEIVDAESHNIALPAVIGQTMHHQKNGEIMSDPKEPINVVDDYQAPIIVKQ